jgi:LytS/YehU family sensor histidine kinase
MEFLGQLWHNFTYDYGTNVQTYVAVVGIAWGVDAFRAMREKERRSAALETELVTAELLALKAQLRPHFLFNALNSVVTLMSRDVDAASRTVVELAGLLRLSLSGDGSPVVPLAQEIDFVRRYLTIEETRFSDRLTVSYDLDESLLDAEVPPLVLQPLAENAVRHGIAKRPGRGRILVRARRAGDDLELAVVDDGPGPGGPRPGGLGLANTRGRLERLYGDRQKLELVPAPGGGTEARIVMPFQRRVVEERREDDQSASRGRRAARA